MPSAAFAPRPHPPPTHPISVARDFHRSWGDGIYYGSFKLIVNGAVVHTYGPPGHQVGMFYQRSVTFGDCQGGSTTSTSQSNEDIEVRDEPKGNNGEGPNGGVGAESAEVFTFEDSS